MEFLITSYNFDHVVTIQAYSFQEYNNLNIAKYLYTVDQESPVVACKALEGKTLAVIIPGLDLINQHSYAQHISSLLLRTNAQTVTLGDMHIRAKQVAPQSTSTTVKGEKSVLFQLNDLVEVLFKFLNNQEMIAWRGVCKTMYQQSCTDFFYESMTKKLYGSLYAQFATTHGAKPLAKQFQIALHGMITSF